MPILGNLLFRVKSGNLTITGTDMDLQVSTTIPVQDSDDLEFTLPGNTLCKIVGKLPTEEIEFQFDPEKTMVTVVSGKSRFRIMGLKSEEFPCDLFSYEDAQVIEMSQLGLRTCIRDTQYAIGTDDSKYILKGLLMEQGIGNINFVATDGRRLARSVGVCPSDPFEEFPSTIIPAKTVHELSALLANGSDEPVFITISPKAIRFSLGTGDVVVDSKVIEGNYPNYRQILPGEPVSTVTMLAGDLVDMVQRVRTIGTTQSIILDFTRNKMECSANDNNVGTAVDSMDVAYTGDDMAITVDPSFLMDTLRTIPSGENVEMMIIDELSALSFRVQDNNAYHFIMPMLVMR